MDRRSLTLWIANNKKKNKKPPAPRPRRPPQRKKKPKRTKKTSSLSPYARMLADPCNAQIVPGAFGDPSMRTYRDNTSYSITIAPGQAFSMIWLPEYHCESVNENGKKGNLFTFQSPTADMTWNSTSHPWGNYFDAAHLETQYTTRADPCSRFVNASGVRDARTVAACIDIEYTGRSDSESGQVGSFTAKLGDFWAQATNDTVASIPAYWPDDVLSLCKNLARPSAGATVKWVPNFSGEPLEFYPANTSPIIIGEPGINKTGVDEYRLRMEDPNMIGLAIAGSTDAQTYRITLTKIIEYRQDSYDGRLSSSSSQAPIPKVTPLELAARALSGGAKKADDSWQTMALGAARTIGSGLLKMAPGVINSLLGGVLPL
jgi:hypothetical protein